MSILLTDEYKGPCGCFGEKPLMVDPVFFKDWAGCKESSAGYN